MPPVIPSVVGARAEMVIASALQRAGMEVFVPPFAALSLRGCTLRLAPPKNGQRVGIRWAGDYLVGPP